MARLNKESMHNVRTNRPGGLNFERKKAVAATINKAYGTSLTYDEIFDDKGFFREDFNKGN
jgi:hypothetical protein